MYPATYAAIVAAGKRWGLCPRHEAALRELVRDYARGHVLTAQAWGRGLRAAKSAI
jgi:hypothetical protein